jgi:hypothetical protein
MLHDNGAAELKYQPSALAMGLCRAAGSTQQVMHACRPPDRSRAHTCRQTLILVDQLLLPPLSCARPPAGHLHQGA